MLPDIPSVSVYLQGHVDEVKSPLFHSFTDVMSLVPEAPIEKSVRSHVTFLTPAIFIYTSGTTGLNRYGRIMTNQHNTVCVLQEMTSVQAFGLMSDPGYRIYFFCIL